MNFPGLGYCRGEISFEFVRVAAERLRALGGIGSGLSNMCGSRSAPRCEESALQCQ